MKKYTVQQIDEIIKNEKMTQTEFCQKAGINRGTLWRILNGKRPVSENVSRKIRLFLKQKETSFLKKIRNFFVGA